MANILRILSVCFLASAAFAWADRQPYVGVVVVAVVTTPALFIRFRAAQRQDAVLFRFRVLVGRVVCDFLLSMLLICLAFPKFLDSMQLVIAVLYVPLGFACPLLYLARLALSMRELVYVYEEGGRVVVSDVNGEPEPVDSLIREGSKVVVITASGRKELRCGWSNEERLEPFLAPFAAPSRRA